MKTYPKQVAFAEQCEAIVDGGEDGNVFIFDKGSGEMVQTLRHSNTGQVQTISVSVSNMKKYSGSNKCPNICMFCTKVDNP
jgi:hypothetical protein